MVNTNSIPLGFNYGEPNQESLEAIQESQEFFASGAKGRFTDGKSLIEAALR